jgi:hypothetical protein
MDLLTEKARQKNYPLYSIVIFLGEFDISPTETLYAIPSVIKQWHLQ